MIARPVQLDRSDASILRVLADSRRLLSQCEIVGHSEVVRPPGGRAYPICRKTIYRHLPWLIGAGLVVQRGRLLGITDEGRRAIEAFDMQAT